MFDFDKNIKHIEMLNQRLSLLEKKIYLLAKHENKIALKKLKSKETMLEDYHLEVLIVFYSDKKELASWKEYMLKNSFLKNKTCNINDKSNHNVTSSLWKNKKLNQQKHCWLLHVLYDDLMLSWKDIIKIKSIYFDINIIYQYSYNIIDIK